MKKPSKKHLSLSLETVRTLSLTQISGGRAAPGVIGSGTMCGGSTGCDTWTNPSKYNSDASCL
jgi:hypothetical protein